MTPAPRLQQLIETVQSDAPSDEAIELLSTASSMVAELHEVGDTLLDHFVYRCRTAGLSWSEISEALGVTRQAVHKRFALPPVDVGRMTERARRTLEVATEIARDFNHDYVGTEHLLLAQFAEPESLAARALVQLGAGHDKVKAGVLARSPKGSSASVGDGRYTPRAANAVTQSLAEALELGHNYIGTEHLLLALLHDRDGVAALILADLGVGESDAKALLLEMLAAIRDR